MGYKIKLNRDWPVAHRGAPEVVFKPGVYCVPEDMSDVLAQRCLRAGRGQLVNDEQTKPSSKAKGRAPENKSAA